MLGTLLAEGFITIYQSYVARKNIHIFKYIYQLFIFTIIGTLMIIVDGLLKKIHFPSHGAIIRMMICGVFYLALSVVYFLLISEYKKDNIRIIKKIIGKNKAAK